MATKSTRTKPVASITTTTLRLDQELYEMLRNAAAKTKRTANELVVEGLLIHLQKIEKEIAKQKEKNSNADAT